MIQFNDLKIGTNYSIYQNNIWVNKIIEDQKHLDYLLYNSKGSIEALKSINRIIKLKDNG
jgi:hypothetical protein